MMNLPLHDSEALLNQARADRFRPRELDWVLVPGFGYGMHEQNLDHLLDRSNWARSSPRILVKAEWAESGDLRIFWLPHEASDFRKIPEGELATFEGLHTAIQHAQKENRAALLILHAYIAKYDELLRGLRNDLTVVHASRIVTFYTIDIDIEDGPSCEK